MNVLHPSFIAFVKTHEEKDCMDLLLHQNRYPSIDIPLAVQLIRGRSKAKHKFPFLLPYDSVLYPEKLSLEQSSSELTAKYKASLMHELGSSIADLTGGFGIDAICFAIAGFRVFYVERNASLVKIAATNFATLGLTNIKTFEGEAEEMLPQLPEVDMIYVDPARRNKDKKVFIIEDCTPNISILQKDLLAKASLFFVKLSPMFDLSEALRKLPSTHAVYIIAVKNECKELLLDVRRTVVDSPKIICVDLITEDSKIEFAFTLFEEQHAAETYASAVGAYLYEPNVAILKAGAFRRISEAFVIDKLHRHTHLYTSNQLRHDFPGRIFEVEEVMPFGKKELKNLYSRFAQAHISVRNFPETVDTLRKKTKIHDGGDVYLFFTTIDEDKKVILRCRKKVVL